MTEQATRADDRPLPRLPDRAAESHKGSYGRVLVVGGSLGMSGAVTLSGLAALRTGSGLVFLAVPEPVLPVVAGAEPSYLTIPLPADNQGRIAADARELIESQAQAADAVALGPGLGQSPELIELVGHLYTTHAGPMVLDADALNALAKRRELLSSPGGPRVLTPHPGEFARLTDRSTKEVNAQRRALAQAFAAEHGVVLVLKGHGTIVTDGRETATNPTGNPGLATGGTGDVLTGIIASLLGQGLAPLDAAQLGAYAHGLAGDLAAEELGQAAMISSDLIRFLPAAWKRLAAGRD